MHTEGNAAGTRRPAHTHTHTHTHTHNQSIKLSINTLQTAALASALDIARFYDKIL